MKRFIILTTAALITVFMAASTIAAGEDEAAGRSKGTEVKQAGHEHQAELQEKEKEQEQIQQQQGDGKQELYKGSYLPTDANSIGDPNSVRERAKKYPDLTADIMRIEKGMENEARRWERGATEDRIEISDVVLRQIMDELMLIRKYAKEEKADKTITAIDNILIKRDQNLNRVRDGAKEDRRKKMREERILRSRRPSRMRGTETGNQPAGEDYKVRYKDKRRGLDEQPMIEQQDIQKQE